MILLEENVLEHPVVSDDVIRLSGPRNIEADVYRIGDGNVVKVHRAKYGYNGYKQRVGYRDLLAYELEIMNGLNEEGIKVPNPKGIFRVNNPIMGVDSCVGLVMEEVQGINLDYAHRGGFISQPDYRLACSLMNEELRKSTRVNYEPGFNAGVGNTIWIPDKKDICLVDFTRWTKSTN